MIGFMNLRIKKPKNPIVKNLAVPTLQGPNDSESSWLHVNVFSYLLIKFGVYSLNSFFKMVDNFPEILNFNQLFVRLHCSWLSPFIVSFGVQTPHSEEVHQVNERGELAAS